MFIKMLRSQSCVSGTYRCGVIYEIDEKKHLQKRDADNLLERKFAEKISKKALAEINAKGHEVVASAATIAAEKEAADKASADKVAADQAAADEAVADKAAADKAAADKDGK
ncbi:hypothetical protein SAMN04488005_1513 [Yoonia tamlensis]|uniref:Uncharacterized protein n=1 Tax=Yoonia tamlensis TaxID=390270 RepID=A0A1I6GEA6_9RHOB|nr:hypothetical protein [Yoonia tamlensis]SFR40524.1 hypothetical protein SAMN04488005_1513 [Yoonia tamlensis]